MPRRLVTWIVIADGSRARIVSPRRGEKGFDLVAELSSAEVHAPSRAIGSGRPGRVHESAGAARHAIEPRQDPHDARKAAFIRGLADHLNHAAGEKSFDRLILFAPPRPLGELRAQLDADVLTRLKGAAPKDLTKLPLIELPRHLETLAEE